MNNNNVNNVVGGEGFDPSLIRSPDNVAGRTKRLTAFRKLASGRATTDKLIMSVMKCSMYNASYSSDGDKKLQLLEMMTSKKIPLPNKSFSDGFKIEVLEIKGRDRKFNDIVTITNEYGVRAKNGLAKLVANELVANEPPSFPPFVPKFRQAKKRSLKEALRNKETRRDIDKERARYEARMLRENPPPGVRSIDFKLKVSMGDQSSVVSFTVYRNGSLRASGGFLDVFISTRQDMAEASKAMDKQVQRVHQFLVDNFSIPKNPLEINNVVATFTVNMPINIDGAVRHVYQKMGGRSIFTSNNVIKKTRELKKEALKKKPRVAGGMGIIPMKEFSLRVSMNGKCQIEGTDDPDELWNYYSKDVFGLMKELVKEGLTGPYKAMGRNLDVNTRVKRMQGKPAPDVTRRGTTCPPKKRPVPYSFQGKCPEGHYIRPNPQGQPCCYKIPKNIRYSRQKVVNAYKNANVRIPKSVEDIFLIKGSPNKLVNTSTNKVKNFIETSNDPDLTNNKLTRMNRRLNAYKSKRIRNGGYVMRTLRGNKFENRPVPEAELIQKFGPRWWIQVEDFKIDTRQCTRYSKVALVDIAKRLGIVDVKSTMPKDEICHMIRKKVRGTNMNKTNQRRAGVSVMDGKKKRFIYGSRIGERECKTFPKKKLIDFAEQLGAKLEGGESAPDICRVIQERAEGRREQAAKNAEARRANAEKRREEVQKKAASAEKRAKEAAVENRATILDEAGLSAKKIYKSMDDILGQNVVFLTRDQRKNIAREAGRIANADKNTNFTNARDVKKLRSFVIESIKNSARPMVISSAVPLVVNTDKLKNGFMNAVIKEATAKKMGRPAAIAYAKKLKKNYAK